jgi:methionyl-tRNA formyltransferase
MPDKEVGRGQQMKKNIIKESAEKIGIKHMYDRAKIKHKTSDGTFITDKDVYNTLQALDADFFVIVAYGKIMPADILDIPHL